MRNAVLSSLYFRKYLYFQHLYASEILVQDTNTNIFALILFFLEKQQFRLFFSIIHPVIDFINFPSK